jgi:RNA polymerase sigma factor (sigma-70 family)
MNHQTRASLLLRLQQRDQDAWSEFVQIYVPLLHAYSMKRGLQDSDAADIAQDTIRQVVRHMQDFHYDKQKGSFRGWLLTIASNEIRRHHRKFCVAVGSGDTSVMEVLHQQPSPDDEAEWEAEYRKHLFVLAVRKVEKEFSASTWGAFHMTAIEGRTPQETASQLGISVGAV